MPEGRSPVNISNRMMPHVFSLQTHLPQLEFPCNARLMRKHVRWLKHRHLLQHRQQNAKLKVKPLLTKLLKEPKWDNKHNKVYKTPLPPKLMLEAIITARRSRRLQEGL